MYSIELIERGEQLRYTRRDLSLILERTYCDGHRIFTDSIAAEAGQMPLSFDQRSEILRDLCEFFETRERPAIFVIWEADPHRNELETLVQTLAETGELISIEIDGAKKRQAAEDRQNLKFLRDGWKVTIEGREFTTPDDYLIWMKTR